MHAAGRGGPGARATRLSSMAVSLSSRAAPRATTVPPVSALWRRSVWKCACHLASASLRRHWKPSSSSLCGWRRGCVGTRERG